MTEFQLQNLTDKFRVTAATCWRHENQACLLQPGRLLLPGDLAGTPLLQLLPLLPAQLSQPSKLARFVTAQKLSELPETGDQAFLSALFCQSGPAGGAGGLFVGDRMPVMMCFRSCNKR